MQITDGDMKIIEGLSNLLEKLKEYSKSSDEHLSEPAKFYISFLHERRLNTSVEFLKKLKGSHSSVSINDESSSNASFKNVNSKIDFPEGQMDYDSDESNTKIILSLIHNSTFNKYIEKKILDMIETQKSMLNKEIKRTLNNDDIKYQEKKRDIPVEEIMDSQKDFIDNVSADEKESKDEASKEVVLPDVEIKKFLATYATNDNDTYIRLGLSAEEQEARGGGYYSDSGEGKVGKLEAKDGNATYYAAESKSHQGMYLMAPVKDLSWNPDAINVHAINVFFEIEKKDCMDTSFELLKPAILEKKEDNYFYLIEKGMINV